MSAWSEGWIPQRISLFWKDETVGRTALAGIIRFAVAFLGYSVDQGWLTLPVAGSGQRPGMFIMICAFLVTAGQKNPRQAIAISQGPATAQEVSDARHESNNA